MLKQTVSKFSVMCVVAAGLSVGASGALAQGRGDALTSQMMRQRAEAMKKPESAKAMQTQNVRMMAMEQMSHAMAADPEFQKMHAEMMKDPECVKMMAGCKATLGNEAEMAKVKEEIMADPKAMEMVMDKAMMMNMAKSDPEMMKMMDQGKMEHDKMDAGKMDHGAMKK